MATTAGSRGPGGLAPPTIPTTDATPFTAYADKLKTMAEAKVKSLVAPDVDRYNHDETRALVTRICDTILEEARSICTDRKVMVSSLVLQKTGAGLHTHAAAYWDPSMDGCATVTVDFKPFLAIINIFVVAI